MGAIAVKKADGRVIGYIDRSFARFAFLDLYIGLTSAKAKETNDQNNEILSQQAKAASENKTPVPEVALQIPLLAEQTALTISDKSKSLYRFAALGAVDVLFKITEAERPGFINIIDGYGTFKDVKVGIRQTSTQDILIRRENGNTLGYVNSAILVKFFADRYAGREQGDKDRANDLSNQNLLQQLKGVERIPVPVVVRELTGAELKAKIQSIRSVNSFGLVEADLTRENLFRSETGYYPVLFGAVRRSDGDIDIYLSPDRPPKTSRVDPTPVNGDANLFYLKTDGNVVGAFPRTELIRILTEYYGSSRNAGFKANVDTNNAGLIDRFAQVP